MSSRLPPVMKRSLLDDVKWALAVFSGALLGYLVFGADDPGVLLGAFVGVTVMILVLNVARRVRPPRKT
jgi:hypothetical protein